MSINIFTTLWSTGTFKTTSASTTTVKTSRMIRNIFMAIDLEFKVKK